MHAKKLVAALLGTLATAALAMGSSSGADTVHVGTAMVNGKSTQVLTDAQGLTLYYNTKDSATKVTCTGACAKFWPPLLASGKYTAPQSLMSGLSVFKGPNGPQLEYHGHPLYTYLPDTKPGQAKGEGAFKIWFVATPALKAAAAAASNQATSSSSSSSW
jgi:predicted lipoprotein with Yx(FWY)xxD motif